MGCCISRPSGPNSPYPGGVGASGSARAINDTAQPTGTSSAQPGPDEPLPSPSSASGRPHHRHHNQPLAQHINKPLRRHEWSSRNRVWTPAALARERADFFDTRVTGRQEIWQTLRAALEVLWAADTAPHIDLPQDEGDGEGPSEEDPTIALATAQSILTAADITLPTGDLASGAYDALGNYYSLPEFVVSDPINMRHPIPGDEDGLNDNKRDLMIGDDTAEEGDMDSDEAERRREEKGKAVIDVRDLIQIRARLSEGSQDVTVSVGKGDSVRSVARRAAEEAQLPSNKKIRIAYMGKILKEGSPLMSQGWKQGHIVNAFVFNR